MKRNSFILAVHAELAGSMEPRRAASQVGSRSRHRDRRFRARRGLAPARRASQVRQGCLGSQPASAASAASCPIRLQEEPRRRPRG
jgi:hypothetical protein